MKWAAYIKVTVAVFLQSWLVSLVCSLQELEKKKVLCCLKKSKLKRFNGTRGTIKKSVFGEKN